MTSPDKVQGWPKVKVIKLNTEYKTKYFLVQIPRKKQTVSESESPALCTSLACLHYNCTITTVLTTTVKEKYQLIKNIYLSYCILDKGYR